MIKGKMKACVNLMSVFSGLNGQNVLINITGVAQEAFVFVFDQ